MSSTHSVSNSIKRKVSYSWVVQNFCRGFCTTHEYETFLLIEFETECVEDIFLLQNVDNFKENMKRANEISIIPVIMNNELFIGDLCREMVLKELDSMKEIPSSRP